MTLSVLLLCSFANQTKLKISDFNSTTGEPLASFSNNDVNNQKVYTVNEEYTYDLGRRNGPIGQFAKWKVTSYLRHDASKNGFILTYKIPMINPKALTSYELRLSYTYSSTFSFAFQKQEKHEISLKLASQFGFLNMIDFNAAIGEAYSETTIEDYTWTFGKTTAKEETYSFDLNRIPDGYIFSPCIVVNATEISYEYTVYDHYWWGDFESRDSSEVNQKNTLVVFDISTAELTYCIKKEGQSLKPDHYLHA